MRGDVSPATDAAHSCSALADGHVGVGAHVLRSGWEEGGFLVLFLFLEEALYYLHRNNVSKSGAVILCPSRFGRGNRWRFLCHGILENLRKSWFLTDQHKVFTDQRASMLSEVL